MVDRRCDCWDYMLNEMRWPAPVAATVQEYVHAYVECVSAHLAHTHIVASTNGSGFCAKEIRINVVPRTKQLIINNFDEDSIWRDIPYPEITLKYDNYTHVNKLKYVHNLKIVYEPSKLIKIKFRIWATESDIDAICSMRKDHAATLWESAASGHVPMPKGFIDAFRNFQSCVHTVIMHSRHVDMSDCVSGRNRDDQETSPAS